MDEITAEKLDEEADWLEAYQGGNNRVTTRLRMAALTIRNREADLAGRAAEKQDEIIAHLREDLAEAEKRRVSNGWRPHGEAAIANFALNLKVYLAGSEGWRIACLCHNASAHVRAVEEGRCRNGLGPECYMDWRDAIRAAEEADHADA